jgi:hypothetical protein
MTMNIHMHHCTGIVAHPVADDILRLRVQRDRDNAVEFNLHGLSAETVEAVADAINLASSAPCDCLACCAERRAVTPPEAA